MSCQNCDEAQNGKKMTVGNGVMRAINNRGVAYYRWKNANIEMNGCDEHLREIFDALNEVQKHETSL